MRGFPAGRGLLQQQPCFPRVQAGQDGLYPGVGEVLADHVPQCGAVLVAVDHPQLGEVFGGGVPATR